MALSARATRLTWIISAVLGVPTVACGALAWVGKVVEDSQAGIGHVASAAEVRAILHRAPLTPAQRIVGARDRMADGYNPSTRLGGCLDGASGYLSHFPAGAPEAPEASTLDQEIEARMFRAGRREGDLARAVSNPMGTAPRDAAARRDLAQRLTHDFVSAGFHVGSFDVQGPQGTELVFSHTRCGENFLRGFTQSPEDVQALRAMGYVSVRCEPRSAAVSLLTPSLPPR